MALYEITTNELREIESTTFAKAGVKERQDLQRLLRAQIGIVCPESLVIAEEFSEWRIAIVALTSLQLTRMPTWS